MTSSTLKMQNISPSLRERMLVTKTLVKIGLPFFFVWFPALWAKGAMVRISPPDRSVMRIEIELEKAGKTVLFSADIARQS